MSRAVIEKTVREVFPVGWDFSDTLPDGETLASGLWYVQRDGTTDDSRADVFATSNATIDATETIGSNIVIANQTKGLEYNVDFVGLSKPSGYTLEESFLLRII